MLRECPVTPYAADQSGGCGVPVIRQWPRARFRRAALASVALRPHGQGVSPGPLATLRASALRHEYQGDHDDGDQQPHVDLVEEIPGAARVDRRRPRRTAAMVVAADRRPASCPGASCTITRGCSGGAVDRAVERLVPDEVSDEVRGMRTRSRGPAARSPHGSSNP